MENQKVNNIDYRKIYKKVMARKKLYFYTLPIGFLLACFYILSLPRYYFSETTMAPESSNGSAKGSIGSLASSFGIDLGDVQSSDAITPSLYPDLLEDNGFITALFPIRVESKDKTIKSTYHDYLKYNQKVPWWTTLKSKIRNMFTKPESGIVNQKLNPYILPKIEDDIVGLIRDNVKFAVDKKTGVISISVKDQDPYICKIIADSVRVKLQSFITEYRTSKARTDLRYYERLTAQAKKEYEKSRQLYGAYADANTDVVLESFRAKQEDLENDMQLKYNAYSSLNTRMQAARAKVQERTPAFTLLKGAAVPLKPAGPKRMIFVAFILFLTFIGTTLYIANKPLT